MSAPWTAMSPDPAAINYFIGEVIRDAIQIVAIVPDGKIEGRWFGANIASAAQWAMRQNAAGWNIYWTVNVAQDGTHRKSSKSDMTHARFVHVDVDPPKDGVDWNREVVLTKIQALMPSFIIFSGNGFQAFWRLDALTSNFVLVEGINRAIAAQLGGDTCHNIDRLMRVPGTINYPNQKKRLAGRISARASLILSE